LSLSCPCAGATEAKSRAKVHAAAAANLKGSRFTMFLLFKTDVV
jgi:hypothetical protein